jgi:hypothetical protein
VAAEWSAMQTKKFLVVQILSLGLDPYVFDELIVDLEPNFYMHFFDNSLFNNAKVTDVARPVVYVI